MFPNQCGGIFVEENKKLVTTLASGGSGFERNLGHEKLTFI